MQAMTIDPDLGKAVFQVHDVDAFGGQWASQWEQSTPMKMPRRSRSEDATPEQVAASLRHFAHPIPGDLWAELKHETLLREDAPVPADSA
jgi:hypothetical protein